MRATQTFGVDRKIGMHVAVAGMHVQGHEQPAFQHAFVDGIDLRTDGIKGTAVENLHQRLADFLLPRHAQRVVLKSEEDSG